MALSSYDKVDIYKENFLDNEPSDQLKIPDEYAAWNKDLIDPDSVELQNSEFTGAELAIIISKME